MTDLLAWFNPARWVMLAALAAALLVGVPLIVHRYDEQQQDIGYRRRADQDKAAAEAQTARNRDLQRAAELRYVVKAEARDRFFVTTVKEISDAAAPLAACPVPEPVRLRLNAAAQCARGDSPAACGADVQVPNP